MGKRAGMTDNELHVAQFLRDTYLRAEALANLVDPKMERESVTAVQLDAIGSKARYTFNIVVGRNVRDVEAHELNSASPAPWTKLPLLKRAKTEGAQ